MKSYFENSASRYSLKTVKIEPIIPKNTLFFSNVIMMYHYFLEALHLFKLPAWEG